MKCAELRNSMIKRFTTFSGMKSHKPYLSNAQTARLKMFFTCKK